MNSIGFTILIPVISFFILAFSCGNLSRKFSTFIGVGSIFLIALITIYIDFQFFNNNKNVFNLVLWDWINLDQFHIKISLILDGLSLTMLSVITGVGLLIHIYASWYMKHDEGYSRFFAYTNLFIASMIILILADNLLLMYLGWEIVGLCSYLLIGFYYTNINNSKAAIKAFIITRISDVFLAFALFIIYNELGTLNISKIIQIAPEYFKINNHILQIVTLMIVAGSIGKSAQIPLQTWLADAMAGPTPVSALIHSATMVTVGVYLIARTHILFLLTPNILYLVAIIGTITLIMAGCAALTQTNIKRILAYSTMSQIGYMFLALGVKAWHAAIFHLMIHAFFKALLFLSAGSLIKICKNEQNIFKISTKNLYKKIPNIYICFLLSGSSLSSLPLITAGFYSKDEILFQVWTGGYPNLMIAGMIGAFITSIYIFRMIFIIFHGKKSSQNEIFTIKSLSHSVPLAILLLLSTFLGSFIKLPLNDVFPHHINEYKEHSRLMIQFISSIIVLLGLTITTLLYVFKHQWLKSITHNIIVKFLILWWSNAWGFDWIYHKLFVKPYLLIANVLKYDPINKIMNFPIFISLIFNRFLISIENGKLSWYIASISLGTLLVLGLILII